MVTGSQWWIEKRGGWNPGKAISLPKEEGRGVCVCVNVLGAKNNAQ